jgi:DNA-binding MarR family transcriptional regulator
MRPDEMQAWEIAVRASAEIAARIERDFVIAADGLSISHFQTLRALNATSTDVNMTDLANQLMLSPTRVSRVLGELERDGYVSRRKSDGDGRNKSLRLTPTGQRRVQEATPAYERLTEGEIGSVAGPELRKLSNNLERIARAGRKS